LLGKGALITLPIRCFWPFRFFCSVKLCLFRGVDEPKDCTSTCLKCWSTFTFCCFTPRWCWKRLLHTIC
jgi:hypothetical protein